MSSISLTTSLISEITNAKPAYKKDIRVIFSVKEGLKSGCKRFDVSHQPITRITHAVKAEITMLPDKSFFSATWNIRTVKQHKQSLPHLKSEHLYSNLYKNL